MRHFFCFFLLFFSFSVYAEENIVNVYAWTGEIPDAVIRLFQKSTGIKVNLTTYENNEMMYAKLRATPESGYDVVMPSSYFVDRMHRLNMLEKLDKTKLPHWKNLNPHFLNSPFDPQSDYSVPHIWGITGIFLNQSYYPNHAITRWEDLWSNRFDDQLMLLDDAREVFSMALLTLGYSANDRSPEHIKAAYLKLKSLMPNVKVFASDTIISNIIDEDATIGMAWNGDANKASKDNKNITFIFPQEGFVIWVDNFSIPQHAPHKNAAYAFIDFLIRANIAKEIALATGFPTANLAAQKLLPAHIRDNPTIYPPDKVMHRGQFQEDLDDKTLALYEKYWEELKMSA